MSTSQFFTCDEALELVLHEMDDEFIASAESESEEGSSSDENAEIADEEAEFVTELSQEFPQENILVEGGAGPAPESSDMGVSESSVEDDFPTDEPDSHYLDQEMDTAAAAQNFAISAGSLIPGEVVEISQAASTSASVADSGSTTASATAATVTAPVATAVNPPCGCEKNCLATFSWEEIQQQQFLIQELEKTEKEMFLMGMLLSKQNMSAETRRGKRKHATYLYSYQGEEVCTGAFRTIYVITQHLMKAIKKHLLENGPVPRTHGNTGKRPVNALAFPVLKRCSDFVVAFAAEFGLPHPAPTHGRAGMPPTYLPAPETVKSVHTKYSVACTAEESRVGSYTTFRRIWRSCFPHIKFMTRRTDVCPKCEAHRNAVMAAREEAEKLEAVREFTAHIDAVQAERNFYRDATKASHQELSLLPTVPAPPCPPCSQPLRDVHYTFDFAQQVPLPHMAWQPGPLYFKTPRKVQFFFWHVQRRNSQTNEFPS